MKTGFVLLAAGNSERMGQPKQLLQYRGKPLLRHAAEMAIASGCAPVVVVLGANVEALRPVLSGLPVQIVENPEWAKGMGTSIRSGVEALGDAEALILALADQPLITDVIYRRLLASESESGKPVVASEYSETVGVPVLFTKEYFPELLALKPEQGCKGVILSSGDQALRIACPEAAVDIDTPADYQNLH